MEFQKDYYIFSIIISIVYSFATHINKLFYTVILTHYIPNNLIMPNSTNHLFLFKYHNDYYYYYQKNF